MFLRIVLVMGLRKIQHNLINTPDSDIMVRRQVVGGFGGKGGRETLMAKEKGVDCSLSFLRIFCLCSFLRVEQSSIGCSSGSKQVLGLSKAWAAGLVLSTWTLLFAQGLTTVIETPFKLERMLSA